MRRNHRFTAIALTIWASMAVADNWPNWRGPGQNGVAQGTHLPVKWSAKQNVAWRVELPGKGTSTPIVWEDRIFVTASEKGKNLLFCLDHEGKTLWRVELGTDKGGKHAKASGSNPSPVTDGKHVYAYYKSGDLACLDFSGKRVWEVNVQKLFGADTLWWDLGSSPTLTKENVVIAVMHSGPSYLVAFEKGSGKQVWKADRDLGAPEEAAQSYSTPILVTEGASETLVTVGADHVTAHDGATGAELWRVGGLNPGQERYFRSIASPVVADGMVVAPYARGATTTAIRLGGKGDVTSTHVAWFKADLGADVPTPTASGGRVYLCTDKGKLVCMNIKTGQAIWSEQLEKSRHAFSASPILADGKVYLTREDGKTFVVKQGDQFELLATNEVGETTVASPVLVQGSLLLRTNQSLFCIREP